MPNVHRSKGKFLFTRVISNTIIIIRVKPQCTVCFSSLLIKIDKVYVIFA